MKHIFVSIAFVLTIVSTCYAIPKIGLSKPFWNFGSVREGKVLYNDLRIVNKGDQDLSVNLRGSCECITLNIQNLVLKPGAANDIKITFDSNKTSGKKSDYIFIDSNDPGNESISWIIEGFVEPGNVVSDIVVQNNKYLPHPAANQDNQSPGQGMPAQPPVVIEVYSTANCAYCQKLKNHILPDLLKSLDKQAKINFYALDYPENYRRFLSVEKYLNAFHTALPAVVINNKIIGGEKNIKMYLRAEILELSITSLPDFSKSSTDVSNETVNEKIKSLAVLPIVFAALLDGINPCAFAGIVFFVAYLGMIKKKPMKEIIIAGVLYMSGLFLVYFFIGLGLIKLFGYLAAFSSISRIIYNCIGVITFFLGIFSLIDYYKLRNGKDNTQSEVVLQLPMPIKKLINKLTGQLGASYFFIPFSFVLGALISLLEFFCTGQIYLPTIMYMVKIPALKTKAISLLLLYSFFFIVPLLIIFISLLFALSSGRLKVMDKRHTSIVKLCTGLLFIVLSVMMFIV